MVYTKERKFCTKECYWNWLKTNSRFCLAGEDSVGWKGGKTIDNGYVKVYVGKGKRQKREHVLIMERSIGRKLNSNECVHHIDGDRSNNDINNLQLMTKSEHNKLHFEDRFLDNLHRESGEKHWNSKLRKSDVHWMRSLKARGWSIKEIAKVFSISYSHTCSVLRNIYWED